MQAKCFCEMALLEKIPRTATTTAFETTVLFFVPVRVLNTQIPTLAYKALLGVAQQMSARIRGGNENIFTPKLQEMMAKRLMNGQNSIVGSPLAGECRAPGPLFPLFHAAGRLAGGSFSIVV
jgi:CRP-like cAMP-binding protein